MKWDYNRWPNFAPLELSCKDGSALPLELTGVPEFLDRLQKMRTIFGAPIKISSGYRSPEYNAKVSTTGNDGPHTYGRAVDIIIFGDKALKLINIAIDLGFTGVGISQKGDVNNRFIHLDDLTNDIHKPRPWLWSY